MIGGSAPSVYLKKLQDHKQVLLDAAAMNLLLDSHRIPVDYLRADDFDGFYQARKGALLALIEAVMGKAAMKNLNGEDEGARGPESDDE